MNCSFILAAIPERHQAPEVTGDIRWGRKHVNLVLTKFQWLRLSYQSGRWAACSIKP